MNITHDPFSDPHNSAFKGLSQAAQRFSDAIPQDLVFGPFRHINDPMTFSWSMHGTITTFALLFIVAFTVGLAYGAYSGEQTLKNTQKKSDA